MHRLQTPSVYHQGPSVSSSTAVLHFTQLILPHRFQTPTACHQDHSQSHPSIQIPGCHCAYLPTPTVRRVSSRTGPTISKEKFGNGSSVFPGRIRSSSSISVREIRSLPCSTPPRKREISPWSAESVILCFLSSASSYPESPSARYDAVREPPIYSLLSPVFQKKWVSRWK